jgi:membrane protein required for colicin V production
MTGFDFAVIAVVALSALLAFLRGIVRELIALASWVAAVVLALAFGGTVAAMLPGLDASPAARHVLAFALVLIGVLIAGAALAFLLSRLIRAAGLGSLDRFLGVFFGLARGAAIAVLFVLVAGVTALPRYEWWQNASLVPALVTAALALRPWLPAAWAGRLDYSPAGGKPARPGAAATAALTGESERCAES